MNMKSFIFLILHLTSKCNTQTVCDDAGCKNDKSISCDFKVPATHCIDYEKTIKTIKDKEAIINRINNRRNKVASGEIHSLPPAKNMVKLVWDDRLEYLAQRWADQCSKVYNGEELRDTCLELENEKIGQNIATIYGESPGLTPAALADVWYMQLLHINSSIIKCYKQSNHLHYQYFTQLVWADTNRVGCGGVKFKEIIKILEKEKNRTVNRLVCNFAPSGNQIDRAVYADGAPCSDCPYDGICDSEFKALCNSPFPTASEIPSMIMETSSMQLDIQQVNLTLPVVSNAPVPEEIFVTFSTESSILPKSDDENYIPYEFFTNSLQAFKISPFTFSTLEKDRRNMKAVDDFIELLKKKLSNDPQLKDALNVNAFTTSNEAADTMLTDSSVADFVSRLYSKRTMTTTTKSLDSDYVNSTLLVDLVEAVIFRNNDKRLLPKNTEDEGQVLRVSPVKVQAELAEVKQNNKFTGHYFFPEENEEENEQAARETVESYYDASNYPAADVILELEELKRRKTTKDFIEEILESDVIPDTATSTIETTHL